MSRMHNGEGGLDHGWSLSRARVVRPQGAASWPAIVIWMLAPVVAAVNFALHGNWDAAVWAALAFGWTVLAILQQRTAAGLRAELDAIASWHREGRQ